MTSRILIFSLALAAGCAFALEVSHREWDDPGRIGSAIWLINPHKWPRTVDSIWVRDIGFQSWREARFKAGGKPRAYTAAPSKGAWILLKPNDKRKIRVRARDSLMVSSFEIGHRLMARHDARAQVEEFSLELRIVDNAGKVCSVSVSETRPALIIETSPEIADSERGDE